VTEQNGALGELGQEPSRRDFIYIAATGAAAMGAGLAIWPFIDQMNPAADTRALGSIRVDISAVTDGTEITVMWRGGPVFIRHRTQAMIDEARAVPLNVLVDDVSRNRNAGMENASAADQNRVLRAEYLIVIGICTHLGCVPLGIGVNMGDYDGWYCPCHGSHYDGSARIRRGPAPENLAVPDYYFETETTVKIGLSPEEAAQSGWVAS
tara:strand:+ start:40192 stop:40818 length:627 start_codon:yes stop_codon:yes gene_type:complete